MASSVDKTHNSFFICPSQYVTGSTDCGLIPVRAVMEKGPKWPNPSARLPSPHAFVAFTGKLDHFEINTENAQIAGSARTVVSLDSITYLRTNLGAPAPSHSLQADDEDSVALKKRVKKYAQPNCSMLAKK